MFGHKNAGGRRGAQPPPAGGLGGAEPFIACSLDLSLNGVLYADGLKGTCGASGDMLETCSTSAEPLKGAS